MADPTDPSDEQVEIYRCTLDLEANRVIDELLAPAGIECFLHNRTSHSLPAPSAEAGALFIAVPASQVAEARAILGRAKEDGELDPETGEMIPG